MYVVGGGDAAVEEAMYLTKFARKVTIIHRRNELRAAKSIQEKAFKNEKLHFMWDHVVEEVDGDGMLSKMIVKNTKTGELTTIEADEDDGIFGLFGFIGLLPNSDLFQGVIDMENNYILTDDNMHTNIEGVFAAGDIRKKSLRQVVTAAADGAYTFEWSYSKDSSVNRGEDCVKIDNVAFSGDAGMADGDVDGDGIVTVSDALLAMRGAMGTITLTASQLAHADLDGDGTVTASDALAIMRMAMNG